MYIHMCANPSTELYTYGVATISRMLKNIGLFCKRDLQKRPIFCKETYIFKHPTHRSHPISHISTYTYFVNWDIYIYKLPTRVDLPPTKP